MRTLLGLCVVAVLWASVLHLFFRVEPHTLVTPLTEQLRVAPREPLQRSNPEWDLMARTFTVLAFMRQANTRPELLADVDTILDETLTLDARRSTRRAPMPSCCRTFTRSLSLIRRRRVSSSTARWR